MRLARDGPEAAPRLSSHGSLEGRRYPYLSTSQVYFHPRRGYGNETTTTRDSFHVIPIFLLCLRDETIYDDGIWRRIQSTVFFVSSWYVDPHRFGLSSMIPNSRRAVVIFQHLWSIPAGHFSFLCLLGRRSSGVSGYDLATFASRLFGLISWRICIFFVFVLDTTARSS